MAKSRIFCNAFFFQYLFLEVKEKGSETAKCILNERIYKTKLFGANFMQIGSYIRKLLKIENLEMASWESATQ